MVVILLCGCSSSVGILLLISGAREWYVGCILNWCICCSLWLLLILVGFS